MPIKADFPKEAIQEYMNGCRMIALSLTYTALARLAEQCVNRIRDRDAEDSWNDQTGNLRSSIGYIITQNGTPLVSGGFLPTSAPQGTGAKGQQVGQSYAESIVRQYAGCLLVLVVVAGMEYAVYVEAMDNKDVLASTKLWAEKKWAKMQPKLQVKIEKQWDKLAKKLKLAS